MNTAVLQTLRPAPARTLPSRPDVSPPDTPFRRLLARLEKALVSRDRPVRPGDICPATGAHHRVTVPIHATGGQGRPWKIYGRCDLCGKTTSASFDPA